MLLRKCVVRARFVWIGGEFEENLELRIDEGGNIAEIGRGLRRAEDERDVEWADEALLPGFVNSHSHAFHRHLRGRSQIGHVGGDTFWRWRDNMYGLVDEVDEAVMFQYCHSTFREMLSAGITTVGEFHYVHHGALRFDLDRAVLRAARAAGIRLVLIETLYQRAGFDSPPLHSVQLKRFTSSYDEFIAQVEYLKENEEDETTSIAVAAHSSRAVDFATMKRLYLYAVEQNMAFHVHLEEQPKEVEDCRRHLGSSKCPSDVIIEELRPGPLFTGVHNTFTPRENMERFAKDGANVSICPCTEGYLGDGVPEIDERTALSIGTDCNNRICFLEEMRWAAFSQHTKHNSRSVGGLSASRLLGVATEGGARALNLSNTVGSFEVGKAFDFVSLSLASPLLDGLDRGTLADGIVFSCGNREITRVGVQGSVVHSIK